MPARTAIRAAATSRGALAVTIAVGSGVAVGLGAYARLHQASGRALWTLGFSGLLPMKVWLSAAALVLIVVQVLTASWMWNRLPRVGPAPRWLPTMHRWTGSIAFAITIPVALQCLWTLGFQTYDARVIAHGAAGCLFYGAYAAKMLGLRIRRLSPRAIPVLGGLTFAVFVVAWLTSALWFFTRSGLTPT